MIVAELMENGNLREHLLRLKAEYVHIELHAYRLLCTVHVLLSNCCQILGLKTKLAHQTLKVSC